MKPRRRVAPVTDDAMRGAPGPPFPAPSALRGSQFGIYRDDPSRRADGCHGATSSLRDRAMVPGRCRVSFGLRWVPPARSTLESDGAPKRSAMVAPPSTSAQARPGQLPAMALCRSAWRSGRAESCVWSHRDTRSQAPGKFRKTPFGRAWEFRCLGRSGMSGSTRASVTMRRGPQKAWGLRRVRAPSGQGPTLPSSIAALRNAQRSWSRHSPWTMR